MSGWGDLWGSFTGANAGKAVTDAHNQSDAALQTGLTNANAAYAPYQQTGQQANTGYANALGLNGAAGAQSAWQNYQSNPGLVAAGKQGLDAVGRKYNSAGLANSGAGDAALSYAGIQNYNNYLGQLYGLSGQGMQAAGGVAGNETGFATAKAGNDISYGNALAASKNTFANNLIGLTGAGVGTYNALRKPPAYGGTTSGGGYGSWAPSVSYGS